MVDMFKPLNKSLSFAITLVVFMVSYLVSLALARVFGMNEYFLIIPFLMLVALVSDKLLILQILLIFVVLFVYSIAKQLMDMGEFTTLLELFKDFYENMQIYFGRFIKHIRLGFCMPVLKRGAVLSVIFMVVRMAGLLIRPKKGAAVDS